MEEVSWEEDDLGPGAGRKAWEEGLEGGVWEELGGEKAWRELGGSWGSLPSSGKE